MAALVVNRVRTIDWEQVGQAVQAYRAPTLAAAAAVAAASYLLFSAFDLLGRAYTRHTLSRMQVMLVALISYAFTLNLGVIVGGLGFRFRLYTRFGLDPGTVGRVYALSVLSNWLGFLLLAGAMFASGQVELPPGWHIRPAAMQAAGVLLMAVAAAYVALCASARRRNWVLRGHRFELPGTRMALTQLTMAVCNWMLMAFMIHLLLHRQAPLAAVTGTLMVSAIAGVLAHVPAGLGVTEAVFVALLGDQVPVHEILAALLAYRALYYLFPLALAAVLYGAAELRAARRRRAAQARVDPPARQCPAPGGARM
ncbi:lysylphosphatidylglycerol synthase domain-containing protein [Pigmentiphaga soli]|uniref:lysylphosphatidylglycerol synthase domain-containing protein n=1 Tax=Pigmentiphaga soli TaxID=1007095 RepID=UPI0031E84F65